MLHWIVITSYMMVIMVKIWVGTIPTKKKCEYYRITISVHGNINGTSLMTSAKGYLLIT